jgi:hypothetical protein
LVVTLSCAAREPKEDSPPEVAVPNVAKSEVGSEKAGAKPASGDPRSSPRTAVAAAVEQDDAPRVYAKTRYVWIRPEPTSEHQWIGFLWTGSSVRLKSSKPRYGPGCRTWYAIEPRGYVCVDGERATLDKDDPAYQAILHYRADRSSAFPHRYAESLGTPLYRSLPAPATQRAREWDLKNHMKRVADARQGVAEAALEGVDVSLTDKAPFEFPPLPPTIHEPRDKLLARSTLAYSTEVSAHDRSWLLSADMRWVPKDRVVPFERIDFKGLHLGKDAHLPLAFFRVADRPKYSRNAQGEFVQSQDKWRRLSFVELTAAQVRQDDELFIKTKDGDYWVKKSETVVPTPRAETPWGAPVGQDDTTGKAPAGRGTWIEVSVWGGWLIAYQGTRPVFATLISPGRGGTPRPGKDPLETSATPTGRFPISGKFVTATMVAPGDLVHSDVPWTQNFSGPYALHSAYWHNDWGNRKSGGCVNVSPIDGRWLFEFTEPRLPDGWHGVRWLPKLESATAFIVRE